MKRRVIDYLCTDPGCKLASAWHQFDASTFALEEPGEYTVTLRVREVVTKQPNAVKHYPPGMQEESQRLHREYNKLVAGLCLFCHPCLRTAPARVALPQKVLNALPEHCTRITKSSGGASVAAPPIARRLRSLPGNSLDDAADGGK